MRERTSNEAPISQIKALIRMADRARYGGDCELAADEATRAAGQCGDLSLTILILVREIRQQERHGDTGIADNLRRLVRELQTK